MNKYLVTVPISFPLLILKYIKKHIISLYRNCNSCKCFKSDKGVISLTVGYKLLQSLKIEKTDLCSSRLRFTKGNWTSLILSSNVMAMYFLSSFVACQVVLLLLFCSSFFLRVWFAPCPVLFFVGLTSG